MTPPDPALVSVVIPTYNYGHLVAEAIDSALGQTYPAVEVIVVDDGSNDDTPARLAAYGDRIRVIRQPNQGLSAARNTGIRAARGDLIALLDADDAFHPRKLEIQAAHLAACPEVALLGTRSFSDPAAKWPAADAPRVRRLTLAEVVVKSRFAPSSAIFRKACAAAVGEFDTALRSVEDRDFWIRVAAGHGAALVEADLTYYRETPGSMSKNVERMEEFERRVLEKAFRLPELRGRRLLRRKAHGLAAYSSAFMYHAADRPAAAARRMVASFLWWPVPFRVPDVKMPLARLRLFAAVLRRWAWGRPTADRG